MFNSISNSMMNTNTSIANNNIVVNSIISTTNTNTDTNSISNTSIVSDGDSNTCISNHVIIINIVMYIKKEIDNNGNVTGIAASYSKATHEVVISSKAIYKVVSYSKATHEVVIFSQAIYKVLNYSRPTREVVSYSKAIHEVVYPVLKSIKT